MKEIYSSPNLVDCDYLKMTLDSKGIKCFLKNATSSMWVGTGQLIELWIANDEEYNQAKSIVENIATRKNVRP